MLKKDFADLSENGDVGDWCFEDNDHYLWFWYFSEVEQKKDLNCIPIFSEPFPVDRKEVYWGWNGNKESPTLIPTPKSSLVSILIYGPTPEKHRAHLILADGKFIKC